MNKQHTGGGVMSDYTDLIAKLREDVAGGEYSGGGYRYVEVLPDTAAAVIAAIEALVKERDQAIRDLDAGFAESDHLSAKYYQRMRAAEREMHARELHHFEEEQRSVGFAAQLAKLSRLVGDGAPHWVLRRHISTAPADALRAHDAALIESLADAWSEWETFTASDGHKSIRQHGLSPDDWLRSRAQQIREGKTR